MLQSNKMTFEELKKKVFSLIKNKEFVLVSAFFLLILCMVLLNAPHERYPDEFDNILGGKYLLSGKLIYSGWFTHHGPFAYYLSALIDLIGGTSFVHFRYIYAIFIFIFTLGTYIFLRKSLKGININFYLLFIFIVSLASTYFWGQMLLADILAAYLMAPVFCLVFLKIINRKKFELHDYIFISVLSSCALLSALTYLFLISGLYLFLAIYYFIQEKGNYKIVDILKIAFILVAPYIIYLIYLFVTRSFDDYLLAAIKFNKDYYIYYPGLEGKPPMNPIRYGIIILQGFHNNYSSLLISARDFNFTYPFNITLAVANAVLAIYLILKRKYYALLLLIGFLAFANARSNPLESRETDYQSAVYIVISMFSLSYVLPQLYKELNMNIDYAKKLIFSFLFLVLLVYSFFGFTYILRKFSYKTYNRYMGLAAGIYDGPRIAPYINRIVEPNEYSWIGPFAFEELYYTKSKVPSKYQIYLPGMGKSQEMTDALISDFNKNKPEVIYFDKDYYILGNSPKEYGKPFLEFLNENYVLLDGYNNGEFVYSNAVDPSLLLQSKLYIKKTSADKIIERLKREGLITE